MGKRRRANAKVFTDLEAALESCLPNEGIFEVSRPTKEWPDRLYVIASQNNEAAYAALVAQGATTRRYRSSAKTIESLFRGIAEKLPPNGDTRALYSTKEFLQLLESQMDPETARQIAERLGGNPKTRERAARAKSTKSRAS